VSDVPVAAPPRPRQFGMLWYWLSLLAIFGFAVCPMVLFVAGVIIAGDHNCAINEGNTSPCLIDGTDWAQTLQFFGLAPLYLLATIPIAIVLGVVWVIALLVHQNRWYKRQARQ
jgi:hypothetical protein